jgi:hypothetical protein
MASENNNIDYDRGFAAGMTAGLKLKSIDNTEEQKALEKVVRGFRLWRRNSKSKRLRA